jgi:hypothetical protein
MSRYSHDNVLFFNIPNMPVTKDNALSFHAHTAFDENQGYKLAKAMMQTTPQMTPSSAPRAPLMNLENKMLVSNQGYSKEVSHSKAITKRAGKANKKSSKENRGIRAIVKSCFSRS